MILHQTKSLIQAFAWSLLLSCAIATVPSIPLFGQTAIGGSTPDPSAMLDVQGTGKGVLFPRMTESQRNAISSPATGLTIFNTTTVCLEINLGTPGSPDWQSIKCEVRCGAYVASGVWKRFMCHNLGSADLLSDPFTPSWGNNGGYWQWGIKNEAAPGPTGMNGSTPNDGAPGSWNTTLAPNGSWLDASKTTADPCPDGYRVPTKTQWEGVLNATLNTISDASGSTWSPGATNYNSGMNFGSSLMLPAAGLRVSSTGTLSLRGSIGDYWGSTELGTDLAGVLYFNSGGASVSVSYRTGGLSVRCVAE